MAGGELPSNAPERIDSAPLLGAVLERVGFGRLGAVSVGSRTYSPLVWYALAVVTFETVVLQGYNVATGRPAVFVANPLWLIRPAVLVAAALATESLLARYELAVEHSHLFRRAESPSRFTRLVPRSLSAVLISAGVVFTVLNAVVILTVPQIYDAGGPARVVRFLLVTPFGYVPVFATFLATYVAVELLLPYRLQRGDVAVDFLDPEQLGGMRPIGELLKQAYYYMMVGLVAFAVAVYGPHVLDGVFAYEGLPEPGLTVNVLFTAVWVAAVLVMVYGIYLLHRYMAVEKREALHRLDRLARERLDDPWDIESFDAADLDEEYETHRKRVQYVTDTREYPATFTMWTQLVVGVMLPKALQLTLSAV